MLDQWASLEVPVAYGLSLNAGTLAVACADGLVRLFRASDLQYTATLPRPPPLGHANIASIRELQEVEAADGAAAAKIATPPAKESKFGLADDAVIRVSAADQNSGDHKNEGLGEQEASIRGVNDDRALLYPAALGCRLSPSGTKVVCVYADRGLFIWDVTDPLCVGKYRSFLAHGACIWDVQRMPGEVLRLEAWGDGGYN